ncbi:hypothetical protein [Campylobacter lanienae]|uniref:hypothetical protein n=1 Tax=Campylobacter lanienae TaxID=75658 RepID=UPI00242E2C66|nr:hypothetical protein [Campylobacter lanienae]
MEKIENKNVKIEHDQTKIELPNEPFWARAAMFVAFVAGVVLIGKEALKTKENA